MQIDSITSGPRQSNFELLRMFAMFLVLMTHANLVSLGVPSADDFSITPLNAFVRTLLESVAIVCVNVFVLISGWFGIRPNVKGFFKFVFQCIYFLVGLYLIFILCGKTSFSLKGVLECLCLTRSNWFIQSYIGLYILSPVLNRFLEGASKRKLEIFLIAFYGFQTYFGVLRSAAFIQEGYSTFSFIGLYILANYLRRYGSKLYQYGWMLYMGSIIVNTFMHYFTRVYLPVVITFNYINPFVIIGSIGLLMWFSTFNIHPNKTINFISKSSFAVYLFHTDQNIYKPLFINTIQSIYDCYSGLNCITIILGFLLVVFIISILCDLPRRFLWDRLSNLINWGKFSLMNGRM